MVEAFFEASIRVKTAAICFLLAKFVSVVTLASMMLSDIAFYINFGFYVLLVTTSIILCIIELVQAGSDRITPTYQRVKK
tara:strand:- start:550 stop:789 length:240 start_codon:yes stop_codon:yes gene_type:complete